MLLIQPSTRTRLTAGSSWLTSTLGVLAFWGCAGTQPISSQSQPPVRGGATAEGVSQSQNPSLDPNLVPAGFGSLRQDDIALKSSPTGGLQVRAIPLDERFIRLLSPDSYKSLHELVVGNEKKLQAIRDKNRFPSYSVWYVSFFALEQGETRFSPQEFIISSTGRDYRPLDLVPLTPGFGEYRLRQREVQSALMVFDGQLDINQPLTARFEGVSSVTDWSAVLQRVERERALVRSRSGSSRPI